MSLPERADEHTERALVKRSGGPTDRFADSLAEMFGGMKTFGKPLDGPTLRAYIRVLVNIRATQAEIDEAADWFLRNRDEVPTPHDLATRIEQRREDVETMEACKKGVERLQMQLDRERDERFLLVYGTTDPTREQVEAHLRSIGIDPDDLTRTLPLPDSRRAMPNPELVDEGQAKRLADQVEAARLGKASE